MLVLDLASRFYKLHGEPFAEARLGRDILPRVEQQLSFTLGSTCEMGGA